MTTTITPRGAAALCTVLLAACGGDRVPAAAPVAEQGGLAFYAPYLIQPLEAAGFYVEIRNTGTVADTLDGGAADWAATAMLHGNAPGGGMHMTAEGAEVPAGGRLVLEPGAMHLMLEQLATKPKAGDSVTVRLHFRHAGEVTLRAPVKSLREVTQ